MHFGARQTTVMRMDVSDENLALAAASGDKAAFGALLGRHYDRLFAFSFRLTGHRAEAEDLTQDIAMALPRKLNGFRGDARFVTWLYRVAVHAAHDRRRRAMTHTKAAQGWGDWEIARQAEIEEAEAGHDWLRTAMKALPVDLRDTLALTMGEDMTHAEAASVLGVSEGTISWRLSDVRKRLKEMAAKEERDD